MRNLGNRHQGEFSAQWGISGFTLGVIGFFLLFPRDANAYFDPATGNVIVQVVVSILAGIAVGLKLFWAKIMVFIHSIFGRKSAPTTEDE